MVERRGGDVTRRADQVGAHAHPIAEQRRRILPRSQEREWGVRLVQALEGRGGIVALERGERGAKRLHHGLRGVAAIHEEGGDRCAGSQLSRDELQLRASVRQQGDRRPRLDRRGDAIQRQQGPAGSFRFIGARGQQVRRRCQLLRRRLTRDGPCDPLPRAFPGGDEIGPEACKCRIRILGGVHHQPFARCFGGWIGARRIGRAEAQADPDNQADADDDRRSTGATGTYHLGVDLDRLRTLPKAELHLHLDGSLRPQTAVELAAESGRELTIEEAVARLVGPARCRDQAELLSYFDLPISLLQTAGSLRRVTAELVETLAEDGLTYAEIRWAPRLHLERGMSVRDVIEAVTTGISEAASRLGPRTPFIGLIVTAMRSHPPGANVELARAAVSFGPPVIGFDLAGPEEAYPAPPHAAAFVAAQAGGLALTAHAGEVPGPQRIREVLDFGVTRIAHGVTTGGEPELITLVRERDVTLDLCPTSNVQAGIVAELAVHPLAALHRAGVSVSLSTDDRTVSNTSLTEEMARTAVALGLSAAELAAIAINAFRRAFGPRSVVDPMMSAAERAWSGWVAEAPAIS